MSDDLPRADDSSRRPPAARSPNASAAGARGSRTIRLQKSDGAGFQPNGQERRATRRALQDWLRLRTGAELPLLKDLAPHRSPEDWADRFLLSCDPDATRSVFVLCGERVEAAFGQRLIGRALNDILPRLPALIGACCDAMREQAPVEIEDAFRAAPGHMVFYRAVFMPVRGLDPEDRYLMGAYGSFPVHD